MRATASYSYEGLVATALCVILFFWHFFSLQLTEKVEKMLKNIILTSEQQTPAEVDKWSLLF